MELCRLAVAGDERFEVSTLEVDRGGASYTIDTVRELARRFPGRRFSILLGSDAALQIRSWHDAEALLDEAHFVAAARYVALNPVPRTGRGRARGRISPDATTRSYA